MARKSACETRKRSFSELRTVMTCGNSLAAVGAPTRAAQRPDTVASHLTWGYTAKWSYGDSNPRPLACHESLASPATRPYVA
jgi:hypothetical protein